MIIYLWNVHNEELDDGGNVYIIADSKEEAIKLFTEYASENSGIREVCNEYIQENEPATGCVGMYTDLVVFLLDGRLSKYKYTPGNFLLIISNKFVSKIKIKNSWAYSLFNFMLTNKRNIIFSKIFVHNCCFIAT